MHISAHHNVHLINKHTRVEYGSELLRFSRTHVPTSTSSSSSSSSASGRPTSGGPQRLQLHCVSLPLLLIARQPLPTDLEDEPRRRRRRRRPRYLFSHHKIIYKICGHHMRHCRQSESTDIMHNDTLSPGRPSQARRQEGNSWSE